MDPKALYYKQYGEKKLKSDYASFKFLRKIFKKYDLHRENLAVSLLEDGERLLDIGCGNGSLLFKAKDKYKELFGIDIVNLRVEEAKKLFKENNPNTYLYIQDINNGLKFEDSFFDAVTIIAVLEHLFDPFFIIKEIKKVLKPNGMLVVEVPNIAYLKYRIQLFFGKLPITSSPYNWEEIGWDGGHLHYFTLSSLRWLLESQGFKIEKVTGSGLFAMLRNWWPSLLTGDICIKARKIQ